MSNQGKTNEELLIELQKLQQELNFLKTSYDKEATKHKQAEDALQEAKEAAEEYLNISAELIFTIDSQGTITMMNDSGHRLLGHNPGELVGKNWFDTCIPKELRSEIRTVFKGLIGGDPTYLEVYENFILTKSGITCLMLWHNSLLLDKNGRINGLLCSAQDITERKQAEDDLIKSKIFIESVINASPDIIYIYDIEDHKNVYTNDGIQKNLGYTDQDIKQMGNRLIQILMHPEDFAKYIQNTYPKYLTLKDEELIVHEYRMRDNKGNWHWLNCKESIYLRNPVGTPKQIFGVIFDITERKQAEEALLNSLSLTEATIESIHNGILVVSRQGTVIKSNNKFAEMWRISAEILASGDDRLLMESILEQLSDPDGFLAKVSELYLYPESESLDLLYFKDGRIFERISKPMLLEGEPKGRV